MTPPAASRLPSHAAEARPPGAVGARIRGIATHLPDAVLDNRALADLYPGWPAERIYEKTGIRERRIAAAGETASDLAFAAGSRLFADGTCAPGDIDFLILCTQAPDHLLPASACLLQHRLGLPRHAGAVDLGIGCSGFVYALSLAAGLIASGAADTVLVLTADTYSKILHPADRSVRTLFGDAAAATLVSRDETGGIGPFVFGTDGSGARDLIVEEGGFRRPHAAWAATPLPDASGAVRRPGELFMNGGNVMAFTLREVPAAYGRLLDKAGLVADAIDHVVLHQASKLVLDALQKKLGLAPERMPRHIESCGNTVSSSIPLVLGRLIETDALRRGQRLALMGFGVGLSWAGAVMTW